MSSASPFFILLVGRNYDETYKAYLLAESLGRCAGIPKSDLLLLVEEDVPSSTNRILQEHGYQVKSLTDLADLYAKRGKRTWVILHVTHLALATLSPPGDGGIWAEESQVLRTILEKACIPFNIFNPSSLGLASYKKLDAFGYISRLPESSATEAAIFAEANHFIARLEDDAFLSFYKQGLARERIAEVPIAAEPFQSIKDWAQHSGRNIKKIIFHVGTPKTGTTSLQEYLFAHRGEMLAQCRLWYPDPSPRPIKAKHQYLVDLLRHGSAQDIANRFLQLLKAAPSEAETIFFSSEGLYHYWCFGPRFAKEAFRRLADIFHTEIWIWFREPYQFCIANYYQFMRGQKQPLYGFHPTKPMEENLEGEWLTGMLDYLGFWEEAAALVGKENIRAFLYQKNTITECLSALGIPAPDLPAPRQNRSAGEVGIEIFKIINRYDYYTPDKKKITELVLQIENMLGDRALPYRPDIKVKEYIEWLTGKNWRKLRPLLAQS